MHCPLGHTVERVVGVQLCVCVHSFSRSGRHRFMDGLWSPLTSRPHGGPTREGRRCPGACVVGGCLDITWNSTIRLCVSCILGQVLKLGAS